MIDVIKREPVRALTLFVSLIVGAIGVMKAFGVGISEEQQGAVTDLATAGFEVFVLLLGGEFVRANVSPTRKSGGKGSLASIVLAVALTIPLSGCGLIEKATGFLGAQYSQYGAQAEQMFDLLCGRSEAEARGRSFRGVEQERDFIEDVCRSEDAIETYGPLVLDALEQGQGRAMARARARKAGDQ